MRFVLGAGIILSLIIPVSSLAEEQSITRRDGFLKIWETIVRPAEETRETPFADVREGERGYLEITYAKRRGIIDEGEEFFPDGPLITSDALLWLMRTRNVDDPDMLTSDRLPELAERYGLPEFLAPGAQRTLTESELMDVMRVFDQFLAQEDHEISLYSEKFHGKGTAFGESFDMHAMTAAHRTYPHNTMVRVTNIENGQSVTVRINDRGPFVHGRDMDLSLAAFTTIADRSKGVIRARFERLGDVQLLSNCSDNPPRMQRITRDVRFVRGVPHTMKLGESLMLQANAPFVVRSVMYPDSNTESLQNWILEGEAFSFTPSISGEYRFRIGTVRGRSRIMEMDVVECYLP